MEQYFQYGFNKQQEIFYIIHPHTPAFVKPVVEHWLYREHTNSLTLHLTLTLTLVYQTLIIYVTLTLTLSGARCSSVVRVFAYGAMGRRIDPSWGGPIELFLVPASAPRLV